MLADLVVLHSRRRWTSSCRDGPVEMAFKVGAAAPEVVFAATMF